MPDFQFGVARQICEATVCKLATARAHYKDAAGLYFATPNYSSTSHGKERTHGRYPTHPDN
jgi:hypothetical protein